MESTPRYEIVDTIASGDFAVVYRARDRELGREVAVKQIHQQFLTDQRQLARFWQEAQLLAKLQHPHIVTIYDIVRPRGWLILEYMRTSLHPATQGEGIDLDFLRTAMEGVLSALHFLHGNGVIHGDVKPSNLLMDIQGRVKLGDFGLARRVSNEEGSLLKGTTKYMAPELVSAQFGAVGPASDLYSLGFTAFELICGKQFESLFPGLSTFGRDKQIAWMMWHAAADRQLPPIHRVLEGVPEDLAQVIEKMIVKDPARRYHSAAEVLKDLQGARHRNVLLPDQFDPEAEAARLAAARKKKRMRLTAIGAVALSLMLCAFMLWPESPSAQPKGPPEPETAVITNVYPEEGKLAIAVGEGQVAKELTLNRYTKIFINDRSKLLRDLQPKDQIVIKTVKDASGRHLEIFASRPESAQGLLKSVQADQGELVLSIAEGDDKGKDLKISVPEGTRIVLNGLPERDGKPFKLPDLRPNDRISAKYRGVETGYNATELLAERLENGKGTVKDIDRKGKSVTIDLGTIDKPKLRTFPFATRCEVLFEGNINNESKQLYKPSDLQPGDEVTFTHDSALVRIDAHRVVGVTGVIQRVHFDARTMDVTLKGDGKTAAFTVDPSCSITLGGEPIAFDDLRDGDEVDISREKSTNDSKPIAIFAQRPIDPERWVIIVANQNFDDIRLTKLDYPLSDAKAIQKAFVARYRVPANQAILLEDESLVRLKQAIPDRLKNLTNEVKLVVCVLGHAYRDDKGEVYIAPKSFDLMQMNNTGLPLSWLVEQMEACRAKEKLFLMDCTHAGIGVDLKRQPSTSEMFRTLVPPTNRAVFRTITAIAGSMTGQRGLDWKEKGHGLFSYWVAEGFSGKADKNRDIRIEPTELFEYLQNQMAPVSASLSSVQSPELFLPDARPPRLSEDAKKAIRKLAAYLRQEKISLDDMTTQYDLAVQASGAEIEPKLIYGLCLIKSKQLKSRDEALRLFEELTSERPNLLLPMQAVVWLRFESLAYAGGVSEMVELIPKLSKPKNPSESLSSDTLQTIEWCGRLREYAADGPVAIRRPSQAMLMNVDAAVDTFGKQAVEAYERGRKSSRETLQDFDQKIEAATDEAEKGRLKIERRRLVHYAEFPFEASLRDILAGLDR